ncbi:MAG: hypothetical protein PVG84_20430 [Desulfobacterales bacterium]|jgi:hypothetical protein
MLVYDIEKNYQGADRVTPYQTEQLQTLQMVKRYLAQISKAERETLKESLADYLAFRDAVDAFQENYFHDICNRKCYQSKLSACCSRDGIITFFADVIINALMADPAALERLEDVLTRPHEGFKCVFLGQEGCLWQIKPIVCEMFLCDAAEKAVLKENPVARKRWDDLVRQKKAYTWPDRPVLFDTLEQICIEVGYISPLMFLHNSPGLLRVKRQRLKNTASGKKK